MFREKERWSYLEEVDYRKIRIIDSDSKNKSKCLLLIILYY